MIKNDRAWFSGYLLCVLVFFTAAAAFAKDSSAWTEKLRGTVSEHIKFTVEFAVNDTTADRIFPDTADLQQVYYYDRKNTMYRVEKVTDDFIEVGHSLLHKNFIGLLNTNRKNIYLSELFEMNGSYYYFTGKHVISGFVLLLFSIDKTSLPEGKYAVFNAKGEKIINNGLTADEIKFRSGIIVKKNDEIERNSIYPFKLTDNSDTLYITDQK